MDPRRRGSLEWKLPLAICAVLLVVLTAFVASAYQTVGARLQETQARVVEMSTQQVEQRIASAVLRLVTQSGRKIEIQGYEFEITETRVNAVKSARIRPPRPATAEAPRKAAA